MSDEETILKSQLLARLRAIVALAGPDGWDGDPEDNHKDADRALLEYIADNEVSDLWSRFKKWYS